MPEAPYGVLVTVAYDGAGFCGWAAQREGRSVQDALFGAIRSIDPSASAPRGASRTDAGVHAEGQVAAFDASAQLAPRGWVLALNQHLPDDVAVRAARPVLPGFNPRHAAAGKRYRYRLLLDRVRDPLARGRSWRVGWSIDTELLAREALSIQGTHDFTAFRSSRDARTDSVRTVTRVAVEPEADPRVLSVVIEGNAFLYNMVRILVGTLVDVARGRLAPGAIRRGLEGRDRKLAGMTAPPAGLTLEAVHLELPAGSGEPWPR